MRQTWGKSDCRSKTNVSTSNYYLVPQKVATSIISNKAQKRERKLFPLKIEETNLFCHLRQKQATEYNQATKEDIPAPNDVWLKQITPITTVVASLVHMKSKRWTENCTVEKLGVSHSVKKLNTGEIIPRRKYFLVLLSDDAVQFLKRYKVKILYLLLSESVILYFKSYAVSRDLKLLAPSFSNHSWQQLIGKG